MAKKGSWRVLAFLSAVLCTLGVSFLGGTPPPMWLPFEGKSTGNQKWIPFEWISLERFPVIRENRVLKKRQADPRVC